MLEQKLGSFSCPQCGGAIDVQVDEQGLLHTDHRDCEHTVRFATDSERINQRLLIPAVDEDGEEYTGAGLENLYAAELALRKLDLNQIGYVVLGMIGEANHSSWDSVPRSELIGFDIFLGDLVNELEYTPKPIRWQPFRLGIEEWWDEQGKRHVRDEKSDA